MKKVLIASGVAVLAFAMIAGAQTYTFNNNLTVGSTGADVSALQTWLIGKGFHIPAIESGAATKGYFGSQTKTAVAAYQASVGLPNYGYFGPLTRAKVNAGGGVTMTPGTIACPPGYNCVPVGGTTPPLTGSGSLGAITTPGIAGSLSFSLQSTPSNGTSVDKGQTVDVVRFKVQAGDSDMQIQSLSLDFSQRLWLYASSFTLKDDSGTVIGSRGPLTVNDFTEITVGTDYRLRIPVNYIVPRSGSRYITGTVTMLPTSDRAAGNITISRAETRAVDGTGVTDTQTLDLTRTFNFTGGNTGSVIITVDSSSPLQRLVQISTGAETDNIPLAIIAAKSQNRDGLLRSLSIGVNTSSLGVSTLFSDLKLKAGSLTYSADDVASTTVFTDMEIPLPKDVYVPITILAKVARDTNNSLDNISATTTLVAAGTAGGTSNNPVVEDSSYNTIDINETTLISSPAIFSASSAVLSGMNATVSGTAGVAGSNRDVEFTFVLTAGDNTLFVPRVLATSSANAIVATSTTGTLSSTTRLNTIIADPDSLSGDDTSASRLYYVIPAGSSRQFRLSGAISGASGASGSFAITSVRYGTTAGTYDKTINYNIGRLTTASVSIP